MSYGYSEISIESITVPRTGVYIVDDFTLAFFIGFRNKTLWFALLNKKQNYTKHSIPKRNGKARLIHAPSDIMKAVHQGVHVRMLVPLQETLGDHVTAYRKNRSILDAVKRHIPKCDTCDSAPKGLTPKKHACPKKGAYIQMDLKDFFHSTSRAWIRNYFETQGYSFYVSGLIGNLLTVDDIPNPAHFKAPDLIPKNRTGVPQGSPASGAICNLVADQRLDHSILKYLDQLNETHSLKGEWAWRYSRYADDMTFTCGKNPPYKEKQRIVQHLTRLIGTAGYRVNTSKTKVTSSYYQKKLLGTVFNQRPNIDVGMYLKLRAMTHNCLTQGFHTQYQRAGFKDLTKFIQHLRGKINFVEQIHPEKGRRLKGVFNAALTERAKDNEAQRKGSS